MLKEEAIRRHILLNIIRKWGQVHPRETTWISQKGYFNKLKKAREENHGGKKKKDMGGRKDPAAWRRGGGAFLHMGGSGIRLGSAQVLLKGKEIPPIMHKREKLRKNGQSVAEAPIVTPSTWQGKKGVSA